jgi:hypothetical protein
VTDEHTITDPRDHKFSRRGMAVRPLFDYEEVVALDTELLQIRSRGAKDKLAFFHNVRGNRERFARNTRINWCALRYLSGELKTAVALPLLNATLFHFSTSSAEWG